jgi:hypothetical protein
MFGDTSEGRVPGYGKIAITIDQSISKVLLIDSLDYNLLSVSQLCEMDYNYLFTEQGGSTRSSSSVGTPSLTSFAPFLISKTSR